MQRDSVLTGGTVFRKRYARDVASSRADRGVRHDERLPADQFDLRSSVADQSSGAVRSVLNALQILEAVSELQPVGVSELSRSVGLPKSSVQRAAHTLHTAGWIRPIQGETTRWELTTLMLGVSLRAFGEYTLRDLADRVMSELVAKIGETVHLNVLDFDTYEGLVVHRVDSSQAVRAFVQIGSRYPLHATASGFAMLSRMDEEAVDRLLSRGLETYTEHTVVDPTELKSRLADFRRQGYAVNAGMWRAEVASISSPIVRSDGQPIGALTVSMPFSRFEEGIVEEYGSLLKNAARGLGASAVTRRIG
jgi:IclR family acetate operon transcriptional repressor